MYTSHLLIRSLPAEDLELQASPIDTAASKSKQSSHSACATSPPAIVPWPRPRARRWRETGRNRWRVRATGATHDPNRSRTPSRRRSKLRLLQVMSSEQRQCRSPQPIASEGCSGDAQRCRPTVVREVDTGMQRESRPGVSLLRRRCLLQGPMAPLAADEAAPAVLLGKWRTGAKTATQLCRASDGL